MVGIYSVSAVFGMDDTSRFGMLICNLASQESQTPLASDEALSL